MKIENFEFSAAEKENVAPQPLAAKKEETNKREMTRDGEKDERAKKMRKDEPKENISSEKKPVCY